MNVRMMHGTETTRHSLISIVFPGKRVSLACGHRPCLTSAKNSLITKNYAMLMSRYEYHCPGNMAVRMRQLLLVFTGNLVTVALTDASFLNFSLTADFVLLL